MNSETDKWVKVGNEIRDAREDMELSQGELADSLGLSSAATISDYEIGKKLVPSGRLSEIAKCLKVSDVKHHYWRGLLGYIPKTPKIAISEVIRHLEMACTYLKMTPFPAYIIDCKRQFWAANSQVATLANSVDFVKETIRNQWNVYDLLFNKSIGFNEILLDISRVQRGEIMWFKATNSYRQHEDFYQEYPQKMKLRLTEPDYAYFKYKWENTPLDWIEWAEYRSHTLKFNIDGQEVPFFLSSEPIYSILNNHFFSVTYIPISGLNSFTRNKSENEIFTIWKDNSIESLEKLI